MGGISDDAIRERAYQIWEREGRPHGRDFDHWVQAQVELAAQAAGNGSARRTAPRAPAAAMKAKSIAPSKPSAARAGRNRKS